MPKSENREYRSLVEFTAGTDEYIIEGYACVFDNDYSIGSYNETVHRAAFNNTDMSDCILQVEHEGKVYARTKNNTLQLRVDEHGLFIRADLSKTEAGKQLYNEIKAGMYDKMSFGFTVDTDYYDLTTRHITGIRKLYDVSVVAFPANDITEVTARNLESGFAEARHLEEMKKAETEKQKQRIRILTLCGGKE